jgi:hypothetical protein
LNVEVLKAWKELDLRRKPARILRIQCCETSPRPATTCRMTPRTQQRRLKLTERS